MKSTYINVNLAKAVFEAKVDSIDFSDNYAIYLGVASNIDFGKVELHIICEPRPWEGSFIGRVKKEKKKLAGNIYVPEMTFDKLYRFIGEDYKLALSFSLEDASDNFFEVKAMTFSVNKK